MKIPSVFTLECVCVFFGFEDLWIGEIIHLR